jgi:hypothetical protein
VKGGDLVKSIGQQHVIMPDGSVDLRTVYSDNGRVGFIRLSKKQLMVTLYNAAEDVRGRQTWKVVQG